MSQTLEQPRPIARISRRLVPVALMLAALSTGGALAWPSDDVPPARTGGPATAGIGGGPDETARALAVASAAGSAIKRRPSGGPDEEARALAVASATR